jgi:hypothetical protein
MVKSFITLAPGISDGIRTHDLRVIGGVFYQCATRGQCYKTFYGRNLRIFVISLSVCPIQVFLG